MFFSIFLPELLANFLSQCQLKAVSVGYSVVFLPITFIVSQFFKVFDGSNPKPQQAVLIVPLTGFLLVGGGIKGFPPLHEFFEPLISNQMLHSQLKNVPPPLKNESHFQELFLEQRSRYQKTNINICVSLIKNHCKIMGQFVVYVYFIRESF